MKTHKTRYLCVDGPMRGEYIYLHGDGKSITFRIKEWVGRYVQNGVASVRWEPVL
jgi:hypothetical protein